MSKQNIEECKSLFRAAGRLGTGEDPRVGSGAAGEEVTELLGPRVSGEGPWTSVGLSQWIWEAEASDDAGTIQVRRPAGSRNVLKVGCCRCLPSGRGRFEN